MIKHSDKSTPRYNYVLNHNPIAAGGELHTSSSDVVVGIMLTPKLSALNIIYILLTVVTL